MRTIGMISLTALILTGLPPVPAAPLPAAQPGARGDRIAPGEDPDARCAPFLEGFSNTYDQPGRGRIAVSGSRASQPIAGNAPPAAAAAAVTASAPASTAAVDHVAAGACPGDGPKREFDQ